MTSLIVKHKDCPSHVGVWPPSVSRKRHQLCALACGAPALKVTDEVTPASLKQQHTGRGRRWGSPNRRFSPHHRLYRHSQIGELDGARFLILDNIVLKGGPRDFARSPDRSELSNLSIARSDFNSHTTSRTSFLRQHLVTHAYVQKSGQT